MNNPRCPHCKNNKFTSADLILENSPRAFVAIVCSHCDVIISIQEQSNISYVLQKIAEVTDAEL
jgi:hypothetical protein